MKAIITTAINWVKAIGAACVKVLEILHLISKSVTAVEEIMEDGEGNKDEK